MPKQQRAQRPDAETYLVRWLPWSKRIPGGWRLADQIEGTKHHAYSRLIVKVAR